MHDLLFFKRVIIVCSVALSATPLGAQLVDTAAWHKLPPVVVVEKARPSVIREGAPLQRLGRAAIEGLGMQHLPEAVKRFPGVTVHDYGGIGGLKTVSVRSLGAKHTAVSYDGIVLADAQSGQVDIGRFSLDNVESVSLSIGQGDNIFQPARMYASAGALQIQTGEPVFASGRNSRVEGKLKGGSFGYFNPSLHYGQKAGRLFSFSTHAEWLSAAGDYPFTLTNGSIITQEVRRNSDVQSLRLEGNLYGYLPGGGKLRAKLYAYNSGRGLPGSVILYSHRGEDRLKDDNFFAQAGYEQPLSSKFVLQAHAKYNYSFSFYSSPDDNYAQGIREDKNTQQEYYGSAGLLFAPHKYVSASLASDISHTSLANNFMNSPLPERLASLTALATQFKSPRLTATFSLLATYMKDEVKHGTRPADKERLSPALSFSYRPFALSAFRLRVSYKDIFRVPTFTDLYYLRMGNTKLKPEKASQYNVGLTWQSGEAKGILGHVSLTADGYYNKVADKIVAFPTLYVWRMMNMGEVEVKGADIHLAAGLAVPNNKKYSLQLTATYSLQEAIDVTNPGSKNYRHQIPYTPRHSGTASAMFTNPWVNAGYLVTVTGERYVLPQNIAQNRMAGYAEHSLSVNKSFRVKAILLRLQGEALNLGGANYDIIQYYPMPGRSFRLSMNIQY
jgi:outer membrane receptor for Fe3+-dicitrate